MKPKTAHVLLNNNEERIVQMLKDLVVNPRVKALEWSAITHQTPNLKIGYPGQHLASLITGVSGTRTGARGDDLVDGTEIKSCSRVDQLDTCNSCDQKVLRMEEKCSFCGSVDIKRTNDSKWLFSIKSNDELLLLTRKIERVLLIIADYPNFEKRDFNCFQIQAFEIWVNSKKSSKFRELMTNYYEKIFKEHIKKNPKKTPAPKNFWPYSFQFYLCAPVKVFSATIRNANISPDVTIDFLFDPKSDRSILQPEEMPTSLLKKEELRILLENNSIKQMFAKDKIDLKDFSKKFPFLPYSIFCKLPLRDTDKISVAKTKYKRR